VQVVDQMSVMVKVAGMSVMVKVAGISLELIYEVTQKSRVAI
jgi:hypothetical protein